MSVIEIRVPDIGEFKDAEVIEILVAVGDTLAVETSLLALETDKASIEIPSPVSGVLTGLNVTLGDRLSEGDLIGMVESADNTAVTEAPSKPAEVASAVDPAPATANAGNADINTEMLVLGAGPGGYSAAFRCADLGMQTLLVERYPTLGGVCLNVGCIPSKALLHTTAVLDEARSLAGKGIRFAEPEIDLAGLRDHKNQVVGKLTSGLAGMAKARKVNIVRGTARFIDAHHLEVVHTEGDGKAQTADKTLIRFDKAIIAAGSQSAGLPFLPADERIIDSTGALALTTIPKRMLILGGGIIGLEMASVYSSLGTRLDVVEMQSGLMPGADKDLVAVWQKHNAHRFDNIMLNTKTVKVEALAEGVRVSFEGEQAPAEPQLYDVVLSAVGRTPNGLAIAAEQAGVVVSEQGFITVDQQMRTSQPHIFAVGDIVGQPMLAHKAVHEAHVAAEAAHGEKSYFDARVIPSVAYTDPEIAWAGVTETQARAAGMEIKKSVFPWAASGRAIANGRDEGFTKLIFDKATHRLVGGSIVGTHAGEMIGEICLAIEMGADAVDLAKTIHAHPTLGESIGLSAEVYEGVCTDLPPQR